MKRTLQCLDEYKDQRSECVVPKRHAACENGECDREEPRTFFFVRLHGKTVTADVPLTFTPGHLLRYLGSKHAILPSAADLDLYLLVGKHVVQSHQTLAEAGVTKDCTVQVLSRLRSTGKPQIWVLAERMQQLCTKLDEGADSLTIQPLLHFISMEGLVPLGASTMVQQRGVLQQLVQLTCYGANHPRAAAISGFTAKASDWLDTLAAIAGSELTRWGTSHRSVQPGEPCAGTPSPEALRKMWPCQLVHPADAAVLLELWLMAVAGVMQRTLYHTGHDDQHNDSTPTLPALDELVRWLSLPPAVPLPRSSDAAAASPVRRRAVFAVVAAGPNWCGSGQSCLARLLAECDGKDLVGVAALLRGITLMLADHVMSSYQKVFKLLPGTLGQLASAVTLGTAPDRAFGEVAAGSTAVAGDTSSSLACALRTLAHAALLLKPVLATSGPHLPAGVVLPAAEPATPAASLPSWWAGPSASVTQSIMAALSASAAQRNAAAAGERNPELPLSAAKAAKRGRPQQPSEAGVAVRACWDFMPLLHSGLDQLQAFSAFMTAARVAAVTVHKLSLHSFLPGCLTDSPGLLFLLAEAWLVLSQLDNQGGQDSDNSTSSHVQQVAALLEHPVVSDWLESLVAGLTPNKVLVSRQKEADPHPEDARAACVASLLDLVAWAPQLADALPESVRRWWLASLLFPAPSAGPTDEDPDGIGSTLMVRREHLLEDSYAELLSLEPFQLRHKLAVVFVGEEAEGVGVLREWLVQLCAALFDPAVGLFKSGASDMSLQHPCVAALLQPNWQEYARVAGRVVGLALRHRVPLGIALSSSFFKALQGAVAAAQPGSPLPAWQLAHPWQAAEEAAAAAHACNDRRQWLLQQQKQQRSVQPVDRAGSFSLVAPDGNDQTVVNFVGRQRRITPTLDDLAEVEPEMISGLRYLLDTPGAAAALGITWAAAAGGVVGDLAGGGGGGEVELVTGGAELAVGEADKGRYVEALLTHKLLGSCWEQVLWFFVGLSDVADPAAAALSRGRLLLPLSTSAFNTALLGSQAELDVAEWRAAVIVGAELKQEASRRTVKMFWQVVSSLAADQRRQLLRFWTGITNLPAGGFSGLGHRMQIMGVRADTAAGGGDGAGGAAPAGGDAAPAGGDAAAGAAGAAGAAAAGGGAEAPQPATEQGQGPAVAAPKAPVLLLPRAHVCFMQLLLPMGYKDVEDMRSALLVALKNVDHFGRA